MIKMKVRSYNWICLSVIVILGANQGYALSWGSQSQPSPSSSTKGNGLSWGSQHTPSETECRPYIERALKDLETPSDSIVSEEAGVIVHNESTENSESQEGSTGEVTISENDSTVVTSDEDRSQTDSLEEASTLAESVETFINEESIEASSTEGRLETEAVSEELISEIEETLKSVEELSTAEHKSTEEEAGHDVNAESLSAENPIHETELELSSESTETESAATEDGGPISEETSTVAVESNETQEISNQKESDESLEESTAAEVIDSTEESIENTPEPSADASVVGSEESSEGTVIKEEEFANSLVEKETTEDTSESQETPLSEETVVEAVVEEIQDPSVGKDGAEPVVSKEEAEPVVSKEETGSTEKSEETVHEQLDVFQQHKEKDSSEDMIKSSALTEPEEEPLSKESDSKEGSGESPEEEELTMDIEVPKNLRSRAHIAQILKLDSESNETEVALNKVADTTLKELKRLYDTAIKPLELLYKYRDLSNRHFGDPEIFSKPLVLFMGPWSGGKSSMINYLLDNEFKKTSLRTGAEPSPAYFNILMWGEEEMVLDGTQLAADWTFSGLQKFGQGLLDRLRGLRLRQPLLEKVNIVEIPGILEVRKQVERMFPFNDACQWFIDRADIIFLIYDPSKLDVGPETEAILDQLKGREYQTRIILNKADQVKPEELMRVQGTLIWNISPLMSSPEPPVMYSTSLWSMPYEAGTPTRLLFAQERAFLQDLRLAIEKRVENKIASARRFAVRVRNHAKMVDCYLTTFYNHKSFFGNRKKIAEDIIEHPQNYHIYEGLSTLTNISRYDLPDPEVYRDFFRLNPVYEFQRLSDTCTYFRGCPINRLDVSIAYDLPELVGRYKKAVDTVLTQGTKQKPIS